MSGYPTFCKDENDRQELVELLEQALTNLSVKDKKVIVINKLYLSLHYARGGGATVNVAAK